MKQNIVKISICGLASGILLAGQAGLYAGAEEAQQDLTGQMAFAQCRSYINIRSEASSDSEVVAKIYNNGAATILEQVDDWYKIQSGNATGYVRAQYFVTGEEAEEIAEQVAYNVAVVYPENLNVRTAPTEEAEVMDVAHEHDELEVVAWDDNWMKVALGADVYGYISADYVDYKTYYPHAETLEEEQARLEAERLAAAATETEQTEETECDTAADTDDDPDTVVEAEAEITDYEPENVDETTQPETETWITESEASDWTEETAVTESEASGWTEETAAEESEASGWTEETAATESEASDWTEETTAEESEASGWTEETAVTESEASDWTEETAAAESDASDWTEETAATESEAADSTLGQQIADYAVQFIGNPYVWGGTSLTNGADCSGFVQSVFANFGISLSRTAEAQSGCGYAVSLDSIQPGDLLFYNSTGSIDHVAIYIGGGMIVHAANSSSGITTSAYNYTTPVAARRCW